MQQNWAQLVENHAPLDPPAIEQLVDWLASPNVTAEEKAECLIRWHRRGETPAEIATMAAVLRARAVPLPWNREPIQVLDVVGTGGDGLGLINLSTAAALIAATAGIPVAKHGNRAATSQCGSADVLEAMGIPINLTPQQAIDSIRRFNFAFLFAPNYHPLFKHIVPARRICAQRGQRTIFNYLGPLLNPARPTWQLLGVPDPELCRPMAEALRQLGVQRAMVVCGEFPDRSGQGIRFMDEISVFGDTWIAEYHFESEIRCYRFERSELPRVRGRPEELAGSDARTNAKLLLDVLEGRDRSARRDAVLANAGAALSIGGRAESILHGYEHAAKLIDSGAVAEKIAELVASAKTL